jgi:hypothetical protein
MCQFIQGFHGDKGAVKIDNQMIGKHRILFEPV